MFDWLRRRRTPGPEPLRGAPPVRRLKTYSAQSGYVYEYVYLGYRAVPAAVEYVFDVSHDRRNNFEVMVLLPRTAVEGWERQNGRELSATERYAIAKMSLFQAFDERDDPAEMRLPIAVRPADAAAILQQLGI
jgi:hypothetical protein